MNDDMLDTNTIKIVSVSTPNSKQHIAVKRDCDTTVCQKQSVTRKKLGR